MKRHNQVYAMCIQLIKVIEEGKYEKEREKSVFHRARGKKDT